MRPLVLSLLLIILYSCAGYRSTQFTANSINIGMNKEAVLKKFGKPFKMNSYNYDEKVIEVVYYKEAVDVSSYTYILTSVLTFENSVLTKIKQDEEYIPDVSIKTQSP